jgi:hypothetical protein
VSKLSGDTIKFGATVTLMEEDTGGKKVFEEAVHIDVGQKPACDAALRGAACIALNA